MVSQYKIRGSMKNKNENEEIILEEENAEELNIPQEVCPVDCKILSWNKHSHVVVFNFEGILIQMKTKTNLDNFNIIKVIKNDNLYEIL